MVWEKIERPTKFIQSVDEIESNRIYCKTEIQAMFPWLSMKWIRRSIRCGELPGNVFWNSFDVRGDDLRRHLLNQ